MTLNEFDHLIAIARTIRIRARDLTAVANNLDEDVFEMVGIKHHGRDTGFPCWTFHTTNMDIGYYNTPRDALEAKIKHEQLPKDEG